MGTFVKTVKAQEMEAGQGKLAEVQGKKIALFCVDGSFYAIDDTCPHLGGSLSEGFVNGKEVLCPWHGAAFDMTTGAVLSPPAARGVSCYRVRVNDGEVEVEI